MALSGSVLVIDDELSLRQTLTRILRQAGCEVTAAADGSEALQRLEGASYNLVFLDIHLHGMDGLKVLKEIHQRQPHLPVVLFTAHASIESAVEAVRLGAIDYLIKPIDPETLVSRARTILEEQARERRRREIQAQIETLQHEMKVLDRVPVAEPAPAPVAGDRFLKRGTLILDLQARRATFGDRVLSLPPAAFDYLVVLTRHAPDIVEYQALVAEAQGYQADRREAQELAKWHIHELRESLEPEPREPQFVLNVRGVGYRLVVD